MDGVLRGAVNLDIEIPVPRMGEPSSRVAQVIARRLEGRRTEGIRSLEVRWILPGRLGSAVAGWLGRFPGQAEIREDVYLVDPLLHGLSAKVRAGTALDVKVYRGSPGVLTVPGRVSGRMEYWQKWSFPRDVLGHEDVGSAAWVPVRKRRRVSRFPSASGEAGCAVELTEVYVHEQDWWSLGFEVTGPDDLLRGELDAATARLFAGPLLASVEFGLDSSRSYAGLLLEITQPTGRAARATSG